MIDDRSRYLILANALRTRPVLEAKKTVAYLHMSNEAYAEYQADVAAYDAWMALPAEERAAQAEAVRVAIAAQRAKQLAANTADWQATRDRYANVPVVLAVLDIHRPDPELSGQCCTHPVSGYEAEPEDWPCDTYTAIKDA